MTLCERSSRAQSTLERQTITMQGLIYLVTCLLVSNCLANQFYGYECEKNTEPSKCTRKLKSDFPNLVSLETCKLTCGPFGSLFPKPQTATLGKDVTFFSPKNVTLETNNCQPRVCPLVNEAFKLFQKSLLSYHFDKDSGLEVAWAPLDHVVQIKLSIASDEDELLLTTDESYNIAVTTAGNITTVHIGAPTFFGARHAMETLTQLINFEEATNSLQIVSSATISDKPGYAYRGLIVDTSRNFMPVSAIKRTIDAMSYSKLNRFHWHITDSQSFPLETPSNTNFSQWGAYSQRKVYKPRDVKDIVAYAKPRGVRVIPEFDAPAHASHGWEWGPSAGMGNLAVCIDKQPWTSYCAGPPCGQLNIANPKIYDMLALIYKDMLDMFGPIDMFHYGGDEIYISCWNSTQEIVDWMVANGNPLTNEAYYQQWSIFQEKARQLVTAANKNVEIPGIIWTSKLIESGRTTKYLDPTKYIIQIWSKKNDPLVAELLKNGYRVIFSNHDALYLDCGFGSWVSTGVNWCSPYKGWDTIYDNDLNTIVSQAQGTRANAGQILGGEAAAWSEQIDASNLDSKIWPRASALGERLWSVPVGNYATAEPRMLEHRLRLVQRGIDAERLQPEWCRLNDNECGLS